MTQRQITFRLTFLLFILSFGASAQVHTIQEKESVTNIARNYNMTPFELMTLNPHLRNGINPGEVIRVSKAVPKGITLYDTYKVGRKETLFGIGQKLGISVEDVKKHNPVLYSKELNNRQILLIPVQYADQAELKTSQSLTYTVKPKDTKWRIAYLHGMTLPELEKLNPDLGETLEIGQVLSVSNPEVKQNDKDLDGYELYTVKPKETLFSLTKALDVSEKELARLNPELENGLKAGMILKIPAKAPKLENINKQEFIELSNRTFSGDEIKLAVMLPFGLKELQADTLLNFKRRFKTDRNLDVTTDFYSGVLIAIDSAKALGIKIDAHAFDTENSEAKVSQIIRSNQLDRADAIIGPLYQKNFERAGELLKDSHVKMFSPLTNREVRLYQNCFQSLPTQEVLESGMLNFMKSKHGDENIVLVADRKFKGVAARVKALFPAAVILVSDTTGTVKQSLVITALSVDKPNWVVMVSENVTLLTTLIPKLSQMSETYNINLMTTDRNKFFEGDEVSSSQLAKLNFHFPSVEKPLDMSAPNPFANRYFKTFGVVPNKYAVRGFDLTFDVLMRLATAKDNQRKFDESLATEYLENRFMYDKKGSGGYMNKSFYILKYNGYNLIEAK
jgi:LysM repeat protein